MANIAKSNYKIVGDFVCFYLKNKDLFYLIHKVEQSPYALELFNRVQNQRRIEGLQGVTIHFVSKDEAGSDRAFASANCEMDEGIISIRSDEINPEKLYSIIFELANLSQKKTKDRIDEEWTKGLITNGEQLARKIERMEFKTNQITNEIFSRSIDNDYWESSLEVYINNVNDFDTFWQEALTTNHAQYYMQIFEKYDIISKANTCA